MNETVTCVRGAFLDAWSGHDWQDGLQVDGLDDLSKLVVRTDNSTYEITVISGRTGEIVIRGGKFFPEFTAARLGGSSLGGSFLKVRGIYIGFNLEINVDSRTIITSRVRTIAA
jgi:hypothetical protein